MHACMNVKFFDFGNESKCSMQYDFPFIQGLMTMTLTFQLPDKQVSLQVLTIEKLHDEWSD